jgi:hypothetical protein
MNSLNEIRYETDINTVNFNLNTVFLAGPTVRGNQPNLTSWRFQAINIFKCKNFSGNIIIPEFVNKYESDEYRYDLPIWEFIGLRNCTVIMFWIPRTKELIGLTTNCKFGYWMAKNRSKMIYGRPDKSYRNTYLDIMWKEDSKLNNSNCQIYNTLENTIEATINFLNS